MKKRMITNLKVRIHKFYLKPDIIVPLPIAETETESENGADDVSSFTAELVEKMEHFKVGQEKVSALKTVAIKLEVSTL